MATLRRAATAGMRSPSVESNAGPTTIDQLVSESRLRIDRVAERVAAIDRLVSAASGLATTIATTEKLAQQRADLLTTRATVLGPRRNGGAHAPIISLADAAKRTGRHPEVLRRWCTEGRIPGVRIGRTWGITPETLALLMAHSTRSRPRLPTPGSA